MSLEEVIRWMLMLLMCVTIAHATELTFRVDENSCGKKVDMDVTESVHLYIPAVGEVQALEDCSFEFTSATFEHDTCFKLTSDLHCNVKIEYRHFTTLIEKIIICSDIGAKQEYCNIYSSMSVLFTVNDTFSTYYVTTVEVYRKYEPEEEDDDDGSLSSVYISTIIPTVLLVLGIFCKVTIFLLKRNCYNDVQNGRVETMAAESSLLETATTRSQGYQPATEANNTAAPPPSYEEAKYYPAPSKSTTYPNDGDGEQFGPGSKVPDVPPPPYPGL